MEEQRCACGQRLEPFKNNAEFGVVTTTVPVRPNLICSTTSRTKRGISTPTMMPQVTAFRWYDYTVTFERRASAGEGLLVTALYNSKHLFSPNELNRCIRWGRK